MSKVLGEWWEECTEKLILETFEKGEGKKKWVPINPSLFTIILFSLIISNIGSSGHSSNIFDTTWLWSLYFQELDNRAGRQGDSDVDVSFPAVAAAGPGDDGKRCIDKVEMVEETEYDEVVQCDHSYDRRNAIYKYETLYK